MGQADMITNKGHFCFQRNELSSSYQWWLYGQLTTWTDFYPFKNIERTWNIAQLVSKLFSRVRQVISTVFVISDMSQQFVPLNVTC